MHGDNQLDLLNSNPAARRTDPVTSHMAADEVTKDGERARQQHVVLRFVKDHPGLTAGELADKYGCERTMFSRRLPELRDAGLVHNGGLQGSPREPEKRKCAVSGKTCVVWY